MTHLFRRAGPPALLALIILAITVSACTKVYVDGKAADGAADAAATEASALTRTVEVSLSDFAITPNAITVPAGEDVTLRVTNTSGTAHDLSVEGLAKTALLESSTPEELHLGTLAAGTYALLCTVPGHADLGMRGTLAVAEAAATTREAGAAVAPMALTSEEMDASYMAGVEAYPAATEGQGNQLLEPTLDGDVKVFDLTASEIDWEVEPGVMRPAMAYNGQVPGPIIRVQLGDTVRVVFHNELAESSAIHYHGLLVPNAMDGVPGITQPLVKPGETFTYEFTVRNTGTHMYHSHMNGANQIPRGLLGAFIVEEPNAPVVDQDIVMVLNDGPLGYTINGKGFPATAPIVATPGQRLRIRYMNEGLQIHPMHLHGMAQTVIAKDGYPLPQPRQEDTVLVAPGERIDVIVEASEAGVWAYHCHILSHAENEHGMFGMVTALIVQE